MKAGRSLHSVSEFSPFDSETDRRFLSAFSVESDTFLTFSVSRTVYVGA